MLTVLHVPQLFVKKMPAGRKSGKGSGAPAKPTAGKTSRKRLPSSSGKTSHGPGGALGGPGASSLAVALEEERCPTPPLLPDNELDDGKLSELSAEEPESCECE